MEIQIVEKRTTETRHGTNVETLIRGKDFVSYNETTLSGLCVGYRVIKVISDSLLEVAKYHHCQGEEDIEEDDLYKWAHVETDATRVVSSIASFKEFDEVYQYLYECIKRQGWSKTVKCR
jgi:hypothetical protein